MLSITVIVALIRLVMVAAWCLYALFEKRTAQRFWAMAVLLALGNVFAAIAGYFEIGSISVADWWVYLMLALGIVGLATMIGSWIYAFSEDIFLTGIYTRRGRDIFVVGVFLVALSFVEKTRWILIH